MRNLFVSTAIAASVLAGAASAQTMATAATDLNIRSGPGNTHEVIGVIGSGDEVSVSGCIESANWCQVTSGATSGWAYGDYLTTKVGEQVEPLYPNRQSVGVAVIEAPAEQSEGANAAVGGATGATIGAVVGGPVGALVGAAIGGSTGAAATPDPSVQTYIVENPRDPVFLEGEVVVGAGVPENVDLYEIPDQPDYRYATINNQPVLVSPTDRRIVYIYR
ncbi:DUF1236 domain-containing protein [Paracoccus aeridis]|uniref:DUF1236 domain-containing protein n=1 Tax=Paracoccus aeridis TaxID=1966466 RepID=UPI0010AA0B14|nr:DUF1236 domain-containing protein [Paracoccus aeridis]